MGESCWENIFLDFVSHVRKASCVFVKRWERMQVLTQKLLQEDHLKENGAVILGFPGWEVLNIGWV